MYTIITSIIKKHCHWAMLFLFLQLTQLSIAQQHDPSNSYYKKVDLVQDYNFMQAILTKCHPGLTRYTTADSMQYWFNYYRTQITDSMTERQFRILLECPIEKIKCGHTATQFSTSTSNYLVKHKYELLPLDIVTNNQKLYVITNNSTDSTIKPLDEIASINGHSAHDILTIMTNFITADGNITTGKERIINYNFARYYRGLVDSATTQIVAINTLKGNVIEHSITCIIPKKTKTESEPEQTLTYLHDSIAVIDLNSFASLKQRRFLTATFKELRNKHTPNLVLDLRNNGGGQVLTAIKVLSYLLPTNTYLEANRNNKIIPYYGYMQGKLMIKLSAKFLNSTKHKTIDSMYYAYLPIKKAKKNNYTGKVFVLVNGGSFSASVIVAAYLKRYNRATIIGQETGGTENGCNAFTMPMVQAPNTKIQLHLPLYQVNNILPQANYGRGVQPNYIVNENLQLPTNTHDACMQQVLKLLSK